MRHCRGRTFLMGLLILGGGLGPLFGQKGQDAGDIARALEDRLTCPHHLITILDHDELYLNLEADEGRGQVLFNGNKVFLLKVKAIDIETEALSIGEAVYEIKGNGPEAFYLDRLKQKLYFQDRRGKREYFADVNLQQREKSLRVSLIRHDAFHFDVCYRYKKAVLYFKNHPVFRLNMRYFPVRGEPRENVISLKGDGPRTMYLNRSRRILYFREGSSSRQGRFAGLKYELTISPRHSAISF